MICSTTHHAADIMNKDTLKVTTPLFLLRGKETCWRCHSDQEVIALLFKWVPDPEEPEDEQPREGEPILLQNIHKMPKAVLDKVLALHPRYEKRTSRTTETAYYMNLCDCGATFGDFYLFSEPGGAFFPMAEQAASRITIHEFPLTGSFDFDSSYSMGLGEFILEHGQRI
jgi:hypothetical protein